MADGDDGEREVLTSLPRTRPVRRSTKRGERGRSEPAKKTPGPSGATAAPPSRKPAASAAPPAAAKAKPKARPKPAAGAPPKAKPKAKANAKASAASDPKPRVPPQRKVPPAGYAAPTSGDGDSAPGATEMLMTAVQAASELAQIGLSVGRQALKSALERLPKP